jgi:hypothetical protein
MSDDEQHAHAFEVGIPAKIVEAIRHNHATRRGQAEDRYNAAMRWLDSLDVDGLLALRWILVCDAQNAYGNNQYYDGMATQLLRAKGVDPISGLDPAAQLLQGGEDLSR